MNRKNHKSKDACILRTVSHCMSACRTFLKAYHQYRAKEVVDSAALRVIRVVIEACYCKARVQYYFLFILNCNLYLSLNPPSVLGSCWAHEVKVLCNEACPSATQ